MRSDYFNRRSNELGGPMKAILTIITCVFLFSCAATNNVGKPPQSPSNPLSEVERAYISQIEASGLLMYEKDIRAANATDILLSKIRPEDYPNFVGWVTYPNKDDFTVSFYEQGDSGFRIIADVIYSKQEKPVINLSPSRSTTQLEVSMLSARIAALSKGANSCSDRFNTVVIPSQHSDLWDVYVLAATTDPKLVQVGGHVKVSVSKETSEVIDVMPLSKSCIALDKSGDDLPKDASISALTVSHIVSPMPVAIHPYLNLLHNINLAVMSERGLWMIKSGKVELL